MSKSFFEKNPKFILLIINLLALALVIFILRLEIFQDAPGAEKYSLYEQLEYNLRCMGKRHIILRENVPNSNQTRIPPYAPNEKYNALPI